MEEIVSALRALDPDPDADFGAPGPIVHALEALGAYAPALLESVQRRPIPHTLWMINRLLNSKLSQSEREGWLAELERVARDNANPAEVREEALDYLQYQNERAQVRS